MTTLEARWSAAKHLILGDDPQVRVYGEASVWFKKIQLFREGENQLQDHQHQNLQQFKSK